MRKIPPTTSGCCEHQMRCPQAVHTEEMPGAPVPLPTQAHFKSQDTSLPPIPPSLPLSLGELEQEREMRDLFLHTRMDNLIDTGRLQAPHSRCYSGSHLPPSHWGGTVGHAVQSSVLLPVLPLLLLSPVQQPDDLSPHEWNKHPVEEPRAKQPQHREKQP